MSFLEVAQAFIRVYREERRYPHVSIRRAIHTARCVAYVYSAARYRWLLPPRVRVAKKFVGQA